MSRVPLSAATAVVLLLWLAMSASAHRLDEYLIDTTFSVHPGRIEAEMRLMAGIKVADAVVGTIDTDHDDVLSETEQESYARRVVVDVTLAIDSKPVQPRLVSATFPAPGDIREGVGEIVLRFDAPVPGGGIRQLSFENRHRRDCAAYMVNALVPTEPGIHLGAQTRSPDQSVYHLDFSQGSPAAGAAGPASWSTLRLWLAVDIVALAFLAAMCWRRRRRHAHPPRHCATSAAGQSCPGRIIVHPSPSGGTSSGNSPSRRNPSGRW
jgi:hypothetical protein